MNDVDMLYISGGIFHDTFATGFSTPGDDADDLDYTFEDLGSGAYKITRALTPVDSEDF